MRLSEQQLVLLLISLYAADAFTLSRHPLERQTLGGIINEPYSPSIVEGSNVWLHSDTNVLAEQLQQDSENVIEAIMPNFERPKHSKSDLIRKARGLVTAGSKDVYRITHSAFGMASILMGMHHMVDIVAVHSFSQPIETWDVATTGTIHIAAGLFGIRRLHFGSENERARNSMFWPIPIQNLWLVSAALTEWGQGSSATFSMFDQPFVVFTAFNLLLTVWQLTEVWAHSGKDVTKDSIWLDDSTQNTVLVEFAYLLWMQIQMGALLYVSSVVNQHSFIDFVDRFPEMHHLLSNLSVNTAFFNNLVAFLATLVRYKVLSKPSNKTDSTIVFSVPILTSLFIAFRVLSCFFGTDEGAMSSAFISLVFQ